MATPVQTIFKKFLAQINDYELALLDDEAIEEVLTDFLDTSIATFSECTKDLIMLPPSNGMEILEAVEGVKEYHLQANAHHKSKIMVNGCVTDITYLRGVDYVIEHLHEDDVQGCLEGAKITFTNPLVEDVQIIWEFDGLIEADLTSQEILILAQGMVLAWVQTKVNREEHLRNYVSDKDLKNLSSANMLDKLILLERNTERKYRIAKQKYSYKDFGGLN